MTSPIGDCSRAQSTMRLAATFACNVPLPSTAFRNLHRVWELGAPLCLSNSVSVAVMTRPDTCLGVIKEELRKRRGMIELDGTTTGTLSWQIIRNPSIAFPLSLPFTLVETLSVSQIASRAKSFVWGIVSAVRAIAKQLDPSLTSRVQVSRRISPFGKYYVLSDLQVTFPDLHMDLATTQILAENLALSHTLVSYLNECLCIAPEQGWLHPLLGARTPSCCPGCFGAKRDPICSMCDGFGIYYTRHVYAPFLSLLGDSMTDLGSFTDVDIESAFSEHLSFSSHCHSSPRHQSPCCLAAPPVQSLRAETATEARIHANGTSPTVVCTTIEPKTDTRAACTPLKATASRPPTPVASNMVATPFGIGMGTEATSGGGSLKPRSRPITHTDLKCTPKPRAVLARRQESKIRQLLLTKQGGYFGSGYTVTDTVRLTPQLCRFFVSCIIELFASWYRGATVSGVQALSSDITIVRLSSTYSFICPRRDGNLVVVHSTPTVCFAFHASGKVQLVCMTPKCPTTHSRSSIKQMSPDQVKTMSSLLYISHSHESSRTHTA